MCIVQSLWIGGALAEMQILSIRSFLAHGHDYHLYAYDAVDDVPPGTTVRDACEILPCDSVFCYQSGFGKGSYSAFSNLFRYKLILERGGWWVDTDVVCLRRFDFDHDFVFATERDFDRTVTCASSVFKSPPGAAFLEYCVDVASGKDKTTLQWGEIGPTLFSDAINRFDLGVHRVPVEAFSPIDYFEYQTLIAPRFCASRMAQSYAVHLWNQMWKDRNREPGAEACADSLYGRLKRQYFALEGT
jgi:hypothetical protein